MCYITYDDFKKLDMRIGHIRFVEPVEGADKLLRCEVDFGESNTVATPELSPKETNVEDMERETSVETAEILPFGKEAYRGRDVRQIVSGIREFFPAYEQLVGKKVLYVVNLEPRTIRGVESHGMLMAVDGLDGAPVFLVPDDTVADGSAVR